MNRYIRSAVFLSSLLVGLMGTLLHAETPAPRFNLTELHQYHLELFEYYPPTACALKALLGEEYEQIISNEAEGGSASGDPPWEKIADREGGILDTHLNWQNNDRRVLWIHPDGTIIVAIRRAERKVTIFTNNPARQQTPPKVIQAFIQYASGGAAENVTWKVPAGTQLAFPAQCEPDIIEPERQAFVDTRTGRTCRIENLKYASFESRFPYIVFPQAGATARTPLRKEPTTAPAPQQRPYLIAGDLVQVLQSDFENVEQTGCYCVYYQALTGKASMGWVDQRDLHPIPDDSESAERAAVDALFKKLPAQQWFSTTIMRENYPGRYLSDQARQHRLHLDPPAYYAAKPRKHPGYLKPAIEGDECQGEFSEVELIAPNKRAAQRSLNRDSSESDVVLYLFNNGIYVSLFGGCDEGAKRFWGIFYPETRK